MPSPFPGMDPYLEMHWRDIHAGLIIYTRDALQGVLPGSLRARVEERVLLEAPEGVGNHPLYPDIRVVEFRRRRDLESGVLGVAVAEPILVAAEPVTETFIEIIDPETGNRVVTVIEFLSPSNKSPGPNFEQYVRKQEAILASTTNLVEIDLNRFGVHTLAVPLSGLDGAQRTPYMTCVRRVTQRDAAAVYPMPLQHPLPKIKIPLRPDDADVPLDLQALIDQCYRNGGYDGTLDYSVAPEPPLRPDDETWAAERLHKLGLRPHRKPAKPKRKSR